VHTLFTVDGYLYVVDYIEVISCNHLSALRDYYLVFLFMNYAHCTLYVNCGNWAEVEPKIAFENVNVVNSLFDDTITLQFCSLRH